MTTNQLTQKDLDFMAYALAETPDAAVADEEEQEISEKERALAAEAAELPKPEREVGRIRSIVSAAPKGLLKTGARALGAIPMGGTVEEAFEDVLPTQKGRFIEGGLEKAGAMAPGVGSGGWLSALFRPILGGFGSQAVEEAPFIPESVKPWVQAGVETVALAAPGLGGPKGKITPTAKQAELVEAARELGFTEKEIAPLIQDPKKVDWLSKIAGKRFRTQKALKVSKNVLDTAAEQIEAHPDIGKVLAPKEATSIMGDIQSKMLSKLNSAERGLVRDDFIQLAESPKSAGDFLKFFRDLNKTIGKNPTARKAVNLLKDDVTKGVRQVSPELAKTLDVTNKLYNNYFKLANKLTPNWTENISQWLGRGIFHSVVGPLLGSFPSLVVIGGEVGAKNLAREMLINPRFQNLSTQIVSALNGNKIGVAKQLWEKLADLVNKTSPEIAVDMEKVDWDSIQNPPEDERSAQAA